MTIIQSTDTTTTTQQTIKFNTLTTTIEITYQDLQELRKLSIEKREEREHQLKGTTEDETVLSQINDISTVLGFLEMVDQHRYGYLEQDEIHTLLDLIEEEQDELLSQISSIYYDGSTGAGSRLDYILTISSKLSEGLISQGELNRLK